MLSRYEISSVDGEKTVSVLDESGHVHVATEEHPNFADILDRCLYEDLHDIEELFDVGSAVGSAFRKMSDRVSYRDGTLFFDNEPVHSSLARTIVKYYTDGNSNWSPLVHFLENVRQNPIPGSIDQLYEWTKNHDITIDCWGRIIAYKGVRGDSQGGYTSLNSGSAIVDGRPISGQIPNKIGSVVEMPRGAVTYDPTTACSTGLHVGTYRYAKGWAVGATLKVIVNPRDVVSVPFDSNGEKIRVCRYEVLDITEQEITDSLYDAFEDWDDDEEDISAHVPPPEYGGPVTPLDNQKVAPDGSRTGNQSDEWPGERFSY